MRDCGVSGDSDHTYPLGLVLKLSTRLSPCYVDALDKLIKNVARTAQVYFAYGRVICRCTVELDTLR